MSHWCCACHTTSHCNVPFPAPATQSHAPTLPGCFNHLPPNVALVLRLPRNVTLQRTCNVFPAPATQTTLQRYQDASIDCACHQMSHWCCATASHCNAPFPARATQSHAPTLPGCACHTTSHCNVHATYHSLHQPPRATLQRYQDASIDCACHQMSHWCCACHTTSQFNVPFPAPATQIHAATGSVTCTSEPISRVMYKRTRARRQRRLSCDKTPQDEGIRVQTVQVQRSTENPLLPDSGRPEWVGKNDTATEYGLGHLQRLLQSHLHLL